MGAFQNNPFRLGLGYDFNLKFKFYDSSALPRQPFMTVPCFWRPFVSRFSIRLPARRTLLYGTTILIENPCPVYCESDITIPIC